MRFLVASIASTLSVILLTLLHYFLTYTFASTPFVVYFKESTTASPANPKMYLPMLNPYIIKLTANMSIFFAEQIARSSVDNGGILKCAPPVRMTFISYLLLIEENFSLEKGENQTKSFVKKFTGREDDEKFGYLHMASAFSAIALSGLCDPSYLTEVETIAKEIIQNFKNAYDLRTTSKPTSIKSKYDEKIKAAVTEMENIIKLGESIFIKLIKLQLIVFDLNSALIKIANAEADDDIKTLIQPVTFEFLSLTDSFINAFRKDDLKDLEANAKAKMDEAVAAYTAAIPTNPANINVLAATKNQSIAVHDKVSKENTNCQPNARIAPKKLSDKKLKQATEKEQKALENLKEKFSRYKFSVFTTYMCNICFSPICVLKDIVNSDLNLPVVSSPLAVFLI